MKKVKYRECVGHEWYNRYEEYGYNGEVGRVYRGIYEDREKIIDNDGLREYGLKDIEDCIRESFEDRGRFDIEINIYNLI